MACNTIDAPTQINTRHPILSSGLGVDADTMHTFRSCYDCSAGFSLHTGLLADRICQLAADQHDMNLGRKHHFCCRELTLRPTYGMTEVVPCGGRRCTTALVFDLRLRLWTAVLGAVVYHCSPTCGVSAHTSDHTHNWEFVQLRLDLPTCS